MRLVINERLDQLEFRSGGTIGIFLFSLPFTAVGWLVVFNALFMKNGIPWFFGIPFGLIFLLAGLGLGFGRSSKTIDRRKGTIDTWWGILFPWLHKTYQLTDLEMVALTQEVRRSKDSSYTAYPVYACGPGHKIKLCETQEYFKSRQFAQQIAKFIHLPLSDSGLGLERIREPETLELNLRQLLLKNPAETLPSQPPNLATTIRRQGNSIMLQLPPRGGVALASLAMAAVVAAALVGALIIRSILSQFEFLAEWRWAALVVLPLLGLLGAFKARKAIAPNACARLILDPAAGLQMQRVKPKGQVQTLKTIPIKEWQELLVPEAGGHDQMPEFLKNMVPVHGAVPACAFIQSNE